MRAVVFYATREGHTRRSAEHIASGLRAHDIAVDLQYVTITCRSVDWACYDWACVAAYGGVMPGYGWLSAIVRSENDPSTVCSDVAPKRTHSSPKPVCMPPAIIASSTVPPAS